MITNPTEWSIAAFTAAKTGALVAAISTFSTPRELSWAVEHSGAATLITHSTCFAASVSSTCWTTAYQLLHREARCGEDSRCLYRELLALSHKRCSPSAGGLELWAFTARQFGRQATKL